LPRCACQPPPVNNTRTDAHIPVRAAHPAARQALPLPRTPRAKRRLLPLNPGFSRSTPQATAQLIQGTQQPCAHRPRKGQQSPLVNRPDQQPTYDAPGPLRCPFTNCARSKQSSAPQVGQQPKASSSTSMLSTSPGAKSRLTSSSTSTTLACAPPVSTSTDPEAAPVARARAPSDPSPWWLTRGGHTSPSRAGRSRPRPARVYTANPTAHSEARP